MCTREYEYNVVQYDKSTRILRFTYWKRGQ
jgi:hypothetical protein